MSAWLARTGIYPRSRMHILFAEAYSILGSIPNGAGTTVLLFLVFSYAPHLDMESH